MNAMHRHVPERVWYGWSGRVPPGVEALEQPVGLLGLFLGQVVLLVWVFQDLVELRRPVYRHDELPGALPHPAVLQARRRAVQVGHVVVEDLAVDGLVRGASCRTRAVVQVRRWASYDFRTFWCTAPVNRPGRSLVRARSRPVPPAQEGPLEAERR